jgi:hypothetical protein
MRRELFPFAACLWPGVLAFLKEQVGIELNGVMDVTGRFGSMLKANLCAREKLARQRRAKAGEAG